MIGKIAVAAANFAIDKPYSYYIPQTMTVCSGMRVQVPFGKGNRMTEGIVLSVEPGQPDGLKAIAHCLDEQPVLSDTMLHLAAFLRNRCFCTFYDAARAMLPAGLWFDTKETYSLSEDRTWQDQPPRDKAARQVLALLLDAGGQADGQLLHQSMDSESLEKALGYLIRKKWIIAHQDLLRRTNDKTEQVATLAASPEEALAYAATRPRSAAMQRSVLELMCSVGSAAVKEICYYTGAKSATVKRLADLGYLTLSQREVLRCRQIKPVQLDGPLVLNDDQQAVCDGLMAQMHAQDPGVALLYGVTGSGKTSVYIRLIRQCIEQGKQAMLLVPEIALTPQLLGLMAAHFGQDVAVLHSSLGASERYDQWKRVKNGQAKVVVGTRSAVFAPCPNLGIIIMDEEQEHSYRSENNPRYDARQVALWRGIREKCLVLLGSATPSVETMYHAKTGTYRLYTMKKRYNGRALPQVRIVNMHDQLQLGNDTSVSYELQDAMGQTMENEKQTILFLNRRGNSRAVVCVDCRSVPECPRCSARLTYHSANGRLMCHYCGHSEKMSLRCTGCGGPMKRLGTGTQKVQEELEVLFPGQTVLRMDADTVSAANTHEMILDRFKNEKIPVLLGTQMVAKGLNLPDVTLVGVLDADMGLYTDSYRAAETTFNMITQVVGRAGRGDTAGQAVIQTLNPEHRVIQLAAKQDYDGFYDLEIGLRQVQQCPPFGDLALVNFSGLDEGAVMRGAILFRDSLRAALAREEYKQENCTVLGPAPCPVPKINYHFRYRLTLRCVMTAPLRGLLAHMLRQFSLDKQNRGISAFVDVNGYE